MFACTKYKFTVDRQHLFGQNNSDKRKYIKQIRVVDLINKPIINFINHYKKI